MSRLFPSSVNLPRRPTDLNGSVDLRCGGAAPHGVRPLLIGVRGNDSRTIVSPGDPLPHFMLTDTLHPSWYDGFVYTPHEGKSVRVPVAESPDTGMKEHVREGVNSFVVKYGGVTELVDRLTAIRSGRNGVAGERQRVFPRDRSARPTGPLKGCINVLCTAPTTGHGRLGSWPNVSQIHKRTVEHCRIGVGPRGRHSGRLKSSFGTSAGNFLSLSIRSLLDAPCGDAA